MIEKKHTNKYQKNFKKKIISTIWKLYKENGNNLNFNFIFVACKVININKNKQFIWMIVNKKTKDALLKKWTHIHI